ncbi:MAG: hypothetical protein IPM47_21275 [Sphingobacteriales bacterium]|nr:MAG: hypothetical protein IPM47_21275 [Sphingobacteriales bacterium]
MSGPNDFTSNSATVTFSNAQADISGVYTVTVTDANGCSSEYEVTVTISTIEGAMITGNTIVCLDDVLTLTASRGTSYEWSGPNGFTSSGPNLVRPDADGTMAGEYTVSVSDGGGCVVVLSTTVTVSGAGFSVSISGINSTTAIVTGTTDVCIGGTINLIASGGNSYVWSGPGGYSSNAHSILRTGANTTMSGVYSVTVSNSTGCTGTANILVTVHTNPSATLSGTSTICSGGTITINAPAGAAAYSWTGPNGFTATGGPSLIRTNANSTMAGQYKVTVTNTGGCTASAARSVSVSAPTTAAVTPTTSTTSFCSNANVIFTATTVGTAYSWTGPEGLQPQLPLSAHHP